MKAGKGEDRVLQRCRQVPNITALAVAIKLVHTHMKLMDLHAK